MGEKFTRNLTEVTEVLARIIDLSWQTRDAEVHHIDDLILVHVSITDYYWIENAALGHFIQHRTD